MNTNAIRDVATKARRQLIEAVERRCLLFGIEEGAQREADTVNGRVLSAAERVQRRELLRVQDELRGDGKPSAGHAALVEQAAYTWFNRLFAIRFMELNDRLPSHVRMLSAQDGSFAPECLREAMDLPLDALDCEEAARLVAEGDDEGLFRLILLAQCAELAECMPAVFEKVGAAMELLMPDGLLAKGGVVESLVTGIPEDDWREGVEIVGWAYQFYVQERHDEVFAGYKKKKKAEANDIAPATQLFTSEWIVKYLTDNSLGRLWVLNNPESPLKDQMEYFVKPDLNYCENFQRVASPEEITLIDPACGSGHFLCYAFDLLASMYEERGYRRRDIPSLILEKNLTGIEIDRRAASLTSFALTMKACEWDSRFLRRGVAPKIDCLRSIELTEEEREIVGVSPEQQALIDVLEHLGEVGSLWRPTLEDTTTLNGWAESAANDSGLFAGSAAAKLARALDYVRTLTSTSVICVTNPPYMGSGNMNAWLSKWIGDKYPSEKADLCTCFITRSMSFTKNCGYSALITSDTCMYNSSFEALRKATLESATILTFIDTRGSNAHPDVFDANAGWVFICGYVDQTYCGTYFRLNQKLGEKESALRNSIASSEDGTIYLAAAERFKRIPGYPIAYRCSDAFLDAFDKGKPLGIIADVKKGLTTSKDAQFLRLWYEVSLSDSALTGDKDDPSESTWFPLNKGGSYRKWFGNNEYVIDWRDSGSRIKNFKNAVIRNEGYYFRESISWNDITVGDPSLRFKGHEHLFNDAGPSIFADEETLKVLLGFGNSSVALSFASLLAPTIHFPVGQMALMPVIMPTEDVTGSIVKLVNTSINISRNDWDAFETSWDFKMHPLVRTNRISSAYGLWSAECKDRFDALRSDEEQLNAIFARIYRMEGEVPIEVPEDKVSIRRADLGRDVRSLISYAVGCMFGRYSLDKPGLVLANQGDGISEYIARVPHTRYMPDDDGILPITDDEYFEDDIVAMFCEFLKEAYGPETLEENLQFVADAIGGTGSARKVIRDYFMNQFFANHCATYSVTGSGKRPIYWLIDSGKLGGFRALVYMHRYKPDLLARVRTDYVHERQERYRSRISELEELHKDVSRREQSAIDKELTRLRAQLDEVTQFEERLHHLADQMIEIDLDDGFKVNYAKFSDVMAKVK